MVLLAPAAAGVPVFLVHDGFEAPIWTLSPGAAIDCTTPLECHLQMAPRAPGGFPPAPGIATAERPLPFTAAPAVVASWIFRGSPAGGTTDLDIALVFPDTSQFTVIHTDGNALHPNTMVSAQSPTIRERNFAAWEVEQWTRVRVFLDFGARTAAVEVEPADGSGTTDRSPPLPLPAAATAVVGIKIAAFHWNGAAMDFSIDDVDLGVDVPAP